MEEENDKPEEESILSLIQQIKDGLLNPKTLSIDSRQRCVEMLIGEGYTESQVAQILQRSEKTIQRDVSDIRQKNSLSPSFEFAKQIVGDIVKKGLSHHDYLVRLSRGKDVSSAEKIQAITSAWNIVDSLVEKLQTLGYLPLKPKEIIGEVYHHEGGDAKTYKQLNEELKSIERIAQETGTLDKDAEESIRLLEKRIEKAAIAEEVLNLTKKDKTNEDINRPEGSKNEQE